MRKIIADHIDLLNKTASEIALSAADNREELLTQSFDQFRDVLLEDLEPILPPDNEPLAKGLNFIAGFASTLRQTRSAVDALQAGRPFLAKADDPAEVMPEEMSDMLDDWVNVGISCLRAMVNSTAELPNEGENLARLERQGNLAKLAGADGEEILIKTELPPDYHEFLTDPVDMLADFATHAQVFQERARAIAMDLEKQDALPDQVIEEFPELFPDLMEELTKAPPPFPPKRGAAPTGDDEELGAGGDPDASPDPGADANADDTPQNPIEMMVRLASIIVVVGGSILQAEGGDQTDEMNQDQDQIPGDNTANPAGPSPSRPPVFAKQAKQSSVFDVPLEKILGGEVEVDPTVADALEELLELRKSAAEAQTLRQELTGTTTELGKLKAMVEQMQKQPAPAKGHTMIVEKRDDTPQPSSSGDDMAKRAQRIEELRETNPEAAARELLKVTHSAGGRPFVSFQE